MFGKIDFMIEGLEYFCQKVKLSTNIKRHNSNIVKYNLFDCLAENHNGKLSKSRQQQQKIVKQKKKTYSHSRRILTIYIFE